MKKTMYRNKVCFACEMCGFIYDDQNEAKVCETWCREHHTCNLDITKRAVNIKK